MVKIYQAVSGEIVLEKLIKTLMTIAVEHAGAERGLLVLPRRTNYGSRRKRPPTSTRLRSTSDKRS